MPDISPIIRVGAEHIDDAARLFDGYRQFYEKSGWTRDAFFHYVYELKMEQQ